MTVSRADHLLVRAYKLLSRAKTAYRDDGMDHRVRDVERAMRRLEVPVETIHTMASEGGQSDG